MLELFVMIEIKLMFVRESIALMDTPARVEYEDLIIEGVTNKEGQIVVEVPLGLLRVEARIADSWIAREIDIDGSQSLVIVDMSARHDKATLPGATPFEVLNGVRDIGDRYRFEKILGRGGMGVVIAATDVLLGRPVAIKMLNDEFSEHDEAQQIFLAEARSIATLSHPNLVGIYDVTMIDGRAMIVFEHVDGDDLDSMMSVRGRLSEATVVRAGIQMARALKYLHGEGVIHRDIKPANMIAQPDGVMKVIDFGLARSLEEIAIKGTQVRGTPAYMAPEQIEGDTLLSATDVYQLGVSLYEVLCGELPFTSGNMGFAHVYLDPPRLEEKLPGVTPALADVIHSCLAKDPAARPSANELFVQLQRVYLAGSVGYDQDREQIYPESGVLFSATAEFNADDLRQGALQIQSRESLADTLPKVEPFEVAPDSAPTDWSKAVTLFGVIGALIAGVGVAIVMMMPDRDPSSADSTDATAVVAAPLEAAEAARNEREPLNVVAPPSPAGAEERELVADSAPDPPPAPELVAAPVIESPPKNKPAANSNTVNSNDVVKKARVTAPAENPPPVRDAPATAPDAEAEDVAGGGEVAQPRATGTEPAAAEEVADAEGAVAGEQVAADKVAADAPDTTDAAEPVKEEEVAAEQPKKTRKVIRKRIIRKKVIRKKVPPKDEKAPASF